MPIEIENPIKTKSKMKLSVELRLEWQLTAIFCNILASFQNIQVFIIII